MSRKSLDIAGQTVAPGHKATVAFPVPGTYLDQESSMPVHVFHGRHKGPSIFVCAAIHGDELNGIEIIRRLMGLHRLQDLAGTLYAIPIVNINGFIANTRTLPDSEDLNRVFPGRSDTTLGAELAQVLFDNVVWNCQYGIDLHTGSNNRTNLPHIRGNMHDKVVLGMAESFGTPLALDMPGRQGTLRLCADMMEIPTLLYEAGEALRFDEFSIRVGLRGLTSVLEHLEMLPSPQGPKPRKQPLYVSTDRQWIRSPAHGLFQPTVHLGQRVCKGELLGTIHDPFGEKSYELVSPLDGVIIGSQSLPSVHKGDFMMHIGCFKALGKAKTLIDAHYEMVMRDTASP